MKMAFAPVVAVCALLFLLGLKDAQLHHQRDLLKKSTELLVACSKQRDFFEAYPTNKNFQVAQLAMWAAKTAGGSNVSLVIMAQMDGIMFTASVQSNVISLRPFQIEQRVVRAPLDQL